MNETAKRDKYKELLQAGNINRKEYKVLFTFLLEENALLSSETIQELSLLKDGTAIKSLFDKDYLEIIDGKYQMKEKFWKR